MVAGFQPVRVRIIGPSNAASQGCRRGFGEPASLGRGIHLFRGLRRVFRASVDSADSGQSPRPVPTDQVRGPTLSLPGLLTRGSRGEGVSGRGIQPFQGLARGFSGRCASTGGPSPRPVRLGSSPAGPTLSLPGLLTRGSRGEGERRPGVSGRGSNLFKALRRDFPGDRRLRRRRGVPAPSRERDAVEVHVVKPLRLIPRLTHERCAVSRGSVHQRLGARRLGKAALGGGKPVIAVELAHDSDHLVDRLEVRAPPWR